MISPKMYFFVSEGSVENFSSDGNSTESLLHLTPTVLNNKAGTRQGDPD